MNFKALILSITILGATAHAGEIRCKAKTAKPGEAEVTIFDQELANGQIFIVDTDRSVQVLRGAIDTNELRVSLARGMPTHAQAFKVEIDSTGGSKIVSIHSIRKQIKALMTLVDMNFFFETLTVNCVPK